MFSPQSIEISSSQQSEISSSLHIQILSYFIFDLISLTNIFIRILKIFLRNKNIWYDFLWFKYILCDSNISVLICMNILFWF